MFWAGLVETALKGDGGKWERVPSKRRGFAVRMCQGTDSATEPGSAGEGHNNTGQQRRNKWLA